MLFDVGAHTGELNGLLNRALQISTPAAWHKRSNEFAQHIRENPLIEHYVNDRFGIERTMERVLKFKAATGRLPNVVTAHDSALHRFFAFIVSLARVHQRLTPAARKRLEGRVRGALRDDIGLASVAYEMQVAAHLMLHGFDVFFHDLEQNGGFDFLASRDGLEIDVECKTCSPDLGRQIHRRRQYQLGGLVHRGLSAALERLGSVFVDINLSGRLTGCQVPAIAKIVEDALNTGADFPGPIPCAVHIRRFSFAESPFVNCGEPPQIVPEQVSDFVLKHFGIDTHNHLLVIKPRTGAGLLAIRSLEPDEVVKGIYHQLKSAADQLSATRPGLVCAQLLDMTPAGIEEIAAVSNSGEPTNFGAMLARFFDSSRRAHVHTVKFGAPGIVKKMAQLKGDLLIHESEELGPAFVLTSKQHPLADDPRLLIFRQ